MRYLSRSRSEKSLAILLAYTMATLGCHIPASTLSATSGAMDYQNAGFVSVPGARVNAADGNLLIERSDISIDTIMGTQAVSASFNSASGEWLWNFQISYDGETFIDPTGASHAVGALADGSPIAGSIWVKVDSTTIETKGGLAYHFDSDGVIDHVRWSTLSYPRIRYLRSQVDGVDFLTLAQCTQSIACMDFFEIEFNEDGAPVVIVDTVTGRRVEYEYSAGRLVRVRDPNAVDEGSDGTQYIYHAFFPALLLEIVNADGERIEYDYQSGRRILTASRVGEGNPTDHFVFQSPSQAIGGFYTTIHTGPLGGKTRLLFDGSRRLRSVELLDTQETATITWNGVRPSSYTTSAGTTTYMTFADDSLVERIDPSGNVVALSHAAGAINRNAPQSSPIARIEDSLGLVADYSYDSVGRLSVTTNGEGDASSFTYNAGSAVASVTDPTGAISTFPFYGGHGHWLDRGGQTPDRRALDAVGNVAVASVVRERGGFLLQTYDANRNLSLLDLGATDTLGKVVTTGAVEITRRSDGQITYIARPGGADHSLVYDALGRLVEQSEWVDGQWQGTRVEYNLAGQVTAQTRSNGMRQEFDYDVYGRLIVHRALRDSAIEGEAVYGYANGQLVSVSDSLRGATETYGYDSAGRLRTTSYGFGETLTREYDVRSRLTRERFDVSGVGLVADLDYEYDLANRQIRITDRLTQELLVEKTFQDGRIVRIQTGNGLDRDHTFDPDTGALTGFTTTDSLGSTIETTEVTYTLEVNPPRQQIRSVTDTSLAVTEEQYWTGIGGSLANLDQRVGKRVFGWNDGAATQESFAYDELGNRVSDPSGNTFNYNTERNRLLSASLAVSGQSHSYVYDEAGFVTSRDGVSITWTTMGRIASHGSDAFEWDMAGRLIAASSLGTTRVFEWFGGRVGGDPALGTLGSLDLGPVSLQLGTGVRTYRHLDFRGNVSFVSDDSGQVVDHYRYAPYGVDAAFGSGADATTFVARTQIGELMVLGFRIYDPAVGRFLSPDPIFQLVNQFAYTLGNPVAYSDPDGLDSADTAVAVGAGVTLVAGVAGVIAEGALLTVAGALMFSLSFALGGLLLALAIAQAFNNNLGPEGGPIYGPIGFSGTTFPSFAGGSCGLLGIESIPFFWFFLAARDRRRRRRLHR